MKLFLHFLLPLLGCGCLSAATVFTEGVLLRYDVPAGNEFAPSSAATGLAGSSLNLGSSAANLEAGVLISGSVFFNPTVASSTAADAFTNDQYFEFTLSSADGRVFQPLTLSFLAANGGASGPRGWSVRSSLDGFGQALASSPVASLAPSMENFTMTLTGFSMAAGDITFRIYGYSPGAGQGIFFDQIEVAGLYQTVPELHSSALLGVGLVLVLRRRQRCSC